MPRQTAPDRLRADLILVAALLVAPAPSHAKAAEGGWRPVGAERGVKLYEAPVAGQDLPRIRGILTIEASVFQLLAVLADLNRACDWNSRCMDSRILERKGLTRVIFYHRTDFPWPVSDRDVVLVTEISGHQEGSDVTAAFVTTTHAKRGPRSGTVRIPRMRGHFRLQRITPTRTRAIYELEANPGGWLPDWVVRSITRGIPSGTLRALAGYERRHRARYRSFVRKHDPAYARVPTLSSSPDPSPTTAAKVPPP